MSTPADELPPLYADAIKDLSEQPTKAMWFGRHFKFKLGAALKAFCHTAMAIVSGHKLKEDPLEAAGFASDVVHALQAFLDAIYKPLSALAYVACIALKGEKESLSIEDVRRNVDALLDEKTESSSFPWYLRLTEKRRADARKQLEDPEALKVVLEQMAGDNYGLVIIDSDEKYTLHDYHVDLGLGLSPE